MKKLNKTTIKQDMNVYSAVEHKKMLLKALDGCQELDIDLSHVSEIDSAGFQILLLTKREALKASKTVRLTGHSKAVTELIDLYNMASYFGDPMVIPAEERAGAKPGNDK
jgi:anti-sigma B factor antagonist